MSEDREREAIERSCVEYFGKDCWLGMTADARKWERGAVRRLIETYTAVLSQSPETRSCDGTDVK